MHRQDVHDECGIKTPGWTLLNTQEKKTVKPGPLNEFLAEGVLQACCSNVQSS